MSKLALAPSESQDQTLQPGRVQAATRLGSGLPELGRETSSTFYTLSDPPIIANHDGIAVQETDAKRPVSYLVKRELECGKGYQRIEKKPILTKVSCTSVWCPDCFKRRTGRRASVNMRLMSWRNVRHVVLTVDRQNYSDGEVAYLDITRGKKVSLLVRDLKRHLAKKINRWISFLEWHEDGFPHWHVIIETESQNKKAQIGYENLLAYWDIGGVYETYPENKRQWDSLTGYFQTAGYFDEKEKEQGRLPEWALKRRGMRRVNRSRFGWPDTGKYAKERNQENESQDEGEEDSNAFDLVQEGSRTRQYGVILASCGTQTRLRVVKEGKILDTFVIHVAFTDVMRSVRELKGEEYLTGFHYLEGDGYVGFFDAEDYTRVMQFLLKLPHEQGYTRGQESSAFRGEGLYTYR